MDVSTINKSTKRKLGFEQFGYWLFLSEDGAGKMIGRNWESFFSVVYPENPSIWKTAFAPIDGLREWLAKGLRTHVAPWITEQDSEYHRRAFGVDYEAPTMWYKRGIRNLGVEEEQGMLRRGEVANGGKIWKETLMVTGLRDVVCGADRARASMRGSVERGKLKVVDLDAGHWVMLEMAEETNKALQEFFEEGVGVRSVL